MMNNLLLNTDLYKHSHPFEYPEGTTEMLSYIEARAGKELVFFGLQIFIKDYLLKPITQENINEAETLITAMGLPFKREGFQYILDKYKGYIPVTIKAAPEGLVIPNRNVLATIECHDPNCFWIASFLETALLRAIWYPSTVATNSYECKQVIKRNFELTSDNPDDILFRLVDFGARGVSSSESACIGGAAHLVNFMASDTIEGIVTANRYYGLKEGMAAYSIPATEHSVACQYGKDKEIEYFRHMIKTFGNQGAMFATVGDSYNVRNAAKIVSTILKDELIATGATLVFRPDSGDPIQTPVDVIKILMDGFGYTTNSKGFKVLPSCIRVIQGDGIDRATIEEIYEMMRYEKLAADNISFGQGGRLLQSINRDTYSFAMKCSWAKEKGIDVDIFKEAPGKSSKKGRLTLVKVNGKYETRRIEDCGWKDDEVIEYVLKPVYENGKLLTEYTFDEVRANSNK